MQSAKGGSPILRVDGVGTAQTAGLTLTNATAATSGNQQHSPTVELEGNGWQTAAGGASALQKLGLQNRTVQGSASATPGLDLSQSNGNNGSAGAWMKYGSLRPLYDSSIPSGGLTIAGWRGTPASQSVATAISLQNNEIYFGMPDADAAYIATCWFYMLSTGFQPISDVVMQNGQSGRRWSETWCRRYAGVEQTVAAAATITLDPASGETIRVTLGATGITTVNGAAGYPGEVIRVEIIQDGTGGRTLTGWSSGTNGFLLAGGAYTPTSTANKRDVLTFAWDTVASKWVETARSMNL